MFFKQYTLYENKLSQQLEDDNPYKKKLIQMETEKNEWCHFSLVHIHYFYDII